MAALEEIRGRELVLAISRCECLLRVKLRSSRSAHIFSALSNIVAKVGDGHLARNNRIGTNNLLNQHCASALELESILLTWTRKILLQQYLPIADLRVLR